MKRTSTAWIQGVQALVHRHPLECALMALASLPFFLLDGDMLLQYESFTVFFVNWPLVFVGVFLLHGTRLYKIAPLGVAVVYALLVVFGKEYFSNFTLTPPFVALYLVAAISLLCAPFAKDNTAFIQTSATRYSAVLLSVVLTGGVYLLALSLIGSAVYLFDLNSVPASNRIFNIYFRNIQPLFALLLCPALFLHFQARTGTFHPGVVFRMVFHIISATLVLYSVLLYVYLLYIGIRMELPRGRLSAIILPYFYTSVVFYCLNTLYPNRFAAYYRHFGLIAVAPLGMLYVGVLRRIMDYGFTPSRFYLLTCAVFAGGLCIWLLTGYFWRLRFRFLALAGIATLLVSTFVLDAKAISWNSQSAILTRLLDKYQALDADGRIKDGFDIARVYSKASATDREELRRLQKVAKHIFWEYTGEDRFHRDRLDILTQANLYDVEHPNKSVVLQLHEVPASTLKPYRKLVLISSLMTTDRHLVNHGEGPQFQIDVHAHLHHVFAKHGKDIRTEMDEEEWTAMHDDVMRIEVNSGAEQGVLLLGKVVIRYFPQKGYAIDDANYGIFAQR